MEKKVMIGNHKVSYEDKLHAGIYYLVHELDAEEKKVFFDQAYNHGHATFEDHMGYKFKLVHHGGEYQLVKPPIQIFKTPLSIVQAENPYDATMRTIEEIHAALQEKQN